MSKNPCENLFEEAKQATLEYVKWSRRAVLPPNHLPINEKTEPILITRELLDQLKEAEKKEIEARYVWLKALDAMADCVKKYSI